MPEWLPIQGWRDLIDIALVAVLGWFAIRYFRTTRARAAIAGLALLAVVNFFAHALELRLTAALFQGFFAVLVLVLVVVFQEDLRRVFEQLGSFRRGRPKAPAGSEVIDLLVRGVAKLAASRTGALFVLPGREPLDRHLEGGVVLGGRVSEPLLLSLFDASSPGHDGAVLLRGSKIERFAVHLPLSANHAALGPGGTRHAAALGLAERCDAICIVVSEERGTISIARDGEIRTLARAEDLAGELRSPTAGGSQTGRWWQGRAALDAAMAVAGALVVWLVFVPGAEVEEATLPARIELTNLPADLELESVDPAQVDVTLRGLRRDLIVAEREEVSVVVDGYLARLGRRTFSLSPQDVQKPDALSVVELLPERVKISLKPTREAVGSDGS